MAGRIIYDGGIVTNGLIMYLDAGKSDSYPREGTTWRDISGSNNNGTLVNGPAFTPANGGSIAFDGVDDYVQIASPGTGPLTTIGTGDFTINVFAARTGGSGYGWMLSNWSGTGLHFGVANNTLGGYFGDNSEIQTSYTIQSDGVFHLYSVTRTSGFMRFYVDGVQVGTASNKNNSMGGTNTRIGTRGGGGGESFQGRIFAAQIYNRALSETEILQNYNATKDRYLPNQGNIVKTDLVLSLEARIIESYIGSGTTWRDLTANQSTASLINGPTFSRERGSITFDGVNDYARINSFGRDTVDPLSVFCWVNPSNLTNWSCGGVFLNWIINKRPGGAGSSSEWQFLVGNSKLQISVWDSAGNVISTHPYQNGVYTLQLNQWQYVGFVTSGVNGGILNTYYNGELNLAGSLSGTRAKRVSNMDIGKTGWDNFLYWTGGISSVSIYNRVLSLSEIQQNFNATKAQYGL